MDLREDMVFPSLFVSRTNLNIFPFLPNWCYFVFHYGPSSEALQQSYSLREAAIKDRSACAVADR